MSNISNATRKLICDSLEAGRHSIAQVADIFQVSESSVRRVWNRYGFETMSHSTFDLTNNQTYSRYCESGITENKAKGGNRPKVLTPELIEFIKDEIDENCFISLLQLKDNINVVSGIEVSTSTIARVIGAFNYSFKRIVFRPIAGETEELWAARQQFSAWLLRQHHEGKSVFFLDETGFKVEMRNNYGRAKKGQNAEAYIPNIRSRNISVIAALSETRVVHYEVLPGNCNADRFSRFIDDLAHHRDLAGINNETILIMDNVSFHKSAIVTEMAELRGFTLKYLPAYSPFLNPIESMFGQWKFHIKSVAPKTEPELLRAINGINTIVTAQHCSNYFHHVRSNCYKIMDGQRNNFN